MTYGISRRNCLAWISVLGTSALLAPAGHAVERILPMEEIKATVKENLAKRQGYQPGDLITRRDVQPILAQLARKGFNADPSVIGFDPYLPDNHYMAGLLQTAKGTETLRQLKDRPGALDRLERLAHFPDGQKILRKVLLESKGIQGVEMLLSAQGIRDLELEYGNEPTMKNFTVASGRVFDEATFIAHLETVHQLAEKGLKRPSE
ncbi:MAG: hypothetical protein ACO1RA_12740 [Planctomycetaceae bacterium]